MLPIVDSIKQWFNRIYLIVFGKTSHSHKNDIDPDRETTLFLNDFDNFDVGLEY